MNRKEMAWLGAGVTCVVGAVAGILLERWEVAEGLVKPHVTHPRRRSLGHLHTAITGRPPEEPSIEFWIFSAVAVMVLVGILGGMMWALNRDDQEPA